MRAETDVSIIANVLKHPSIFPYISDDYTPSDWMPSPSGASVFLMPEDNSACFVFTKHSGVLCEGHLAVLPEARKRGEALGRAALDWMKENTDCKAVMGLVQEKNKHACRYVERLGFEQSGRIKKGFAKDGELVDLVIYTMEL
jgi:GNAT superfamily N-acetyltransferase